MHIRHYGVANIKLEWFMLILATFFVLSRCQWIEKNSTRLPKAKTKYGTVRGLYFETVNNHLVLAFQGVPYAKPPLGKLRFMRPQEPDKWEGTLKTTWPGSPCVQMSLTKLNTRGSIKFGREDCLYLDVYTPFPRSTTASNPLFNTRLPVIVNFHGGPFSTEHYMPHVLLDHMMVVFVHVNYRVGPFGFLTMESSKHPGNMGLRDQVQALMWVKENIRNFNGDPNDVTLLGWSEGAASVHYHYLSKRSRVLFNRGISMSGSALCPWALMERGREKSLRLAQALNCTGDDDESIVTCMQAPATHRILAAIKEEFMPWLYNPFSPFGPTIERPFREDDGPIPDAFLDRDPYDIIRNGRAKVAPWLVSNVDMDGLFPGGHFIDNSSCLHELSNNWIDIAPHLLDFNYTLHFRRFKPRVARLILKQYSGANPPTFETSCKNNPKYVVQKEILNMLSDRLFKGCTGLAAQMHAKLNASVYFYVFNYVGKNSVSKYATNTNIDFGSCHGDDLIYTLGSFYRGDELNAHDQKMVDTMTRFWASFVYKGKPSDTWDPVRDYKEYGKLNYLHIDGPEPEMIFNVLDNDYGKINFWTTLNIDELMFWKKNRYFTDLFQNEEEQNEGLENPMLLSNYDYERDNASDTVSNPTDIPASYNDKFPKPPDDDSSRKIHSVSLEDYYAVLPEV